MQSERWSNFSPEASGITGGDVSNFAKRASSGAAGFEAEETAAAGAGATPATDGKPSEIESRSASESALGGRLSPPVDTLPMGKSADGSPFLAALALWLAAVATIAEVCVHVRRLDVHVAS